jgi:hypothetical protein
METYFKVTGQYAGFSGKDYNKNRKKTCCPPGGQYESVVDSYCPLSGRSESGVDSHFPASGHLESVKMLTVRLVDRRTFCHRNKIYKYIINILNK